MNKFTDKISIHIHAGNGGPGSVSFHREKYVPNGGPDGGDGGRGGDVFLVGSTHIVNLSHLFKDRTYKAEPGEQGKSQNRHGKDGASLTIKVPVGTEVVDAETDDLIGDIVRAEEPLLVARGGIGGKGNSFFKSSTHQAPHFSQPGMPGEQKKLVLNLKLIAEVGLVGLPNAGKSTLLSKLTNAKPKIADYPFTTLIPNLGVVQKNENVSYKIADIPGIIEGAHRGLGLGLSFLMHIERVRVILFLIEATEKDPQYCLELLRSELRQYSERMMDKPYYVLLTKVDLVEPSALVDIMNLLSDEHIIPISSTAGVNIDLLLQRIDELLGAPYATS